MFIFFLSILEMTDYYTFGEKSKISKRQTDPVQCCLNGKDGYFAAEVCPENPLRRDVWLCPAFMAQRCARNWDKYCDIYLEERKGEDFTGKAANEFIRQAAETKFCRVDEAQDGFCYERCEMFNPTANSSAKVCKTEGNVTYRESDKLYNLDTDYSSSGKLNYASPLKIKGCKKICDIFNLQDLTNEDKVLNECLDRGVCSDILTNVAMNLSSKNVPVQNERLRSFMNKLIPKPGQPGYANLGASGIITNTQVATPAVDAVIPTNVEMTMPDVANTTVEPSKEQTNQMIMGQPITESFRYLRNSRSQETSSNVMTRFLIICAIAALCYYYKTKK